MTPGKERRAAFLDRDGTLIEDVNFISRPEDVRIIPGVPEALRALHEAGVMIVIVTNQSGIARGIFTADDYEKVAARIDEALRLAGGASADATYLCPHHPAITGPCECRKPGLLLFQQAVDEHDIDVHRSLFVGDKFRDVQPGLTLGGRAILVPTHETPPDDLRRAERDAETAPSLGEAVRRFLGDDVR